MIAYSSQNSMEDVTDHVYFGEFKMKNSLPSFITEPSMRANCGAFVDHCTFIPRWIALDDLMCVVVCMWHMFVYMFMCVCAHVCLWEHLQLLCACTWRSISPRLIFWDRVSHWSWESPNQLGGQCDPWFLLCFFYGHITDVHHLARCRRVPHSWGSEQGAMSVWRAFCGLNCFSSPSIPSLFKIRKNLGVQSHKGECEGLCVWFDMQIIRNSLWFFPHVYL